MLLALPVAAFLYLQIAKNMPGLFPPCLAKYILHIYCPGCGGTHSVRYLLSLRFLDAFLANPLVPCGAIVLLYYWIRMLVALIRGKGKCVYRMWLGWLWGMLILMIAFFLIRNCLLIFCHYDFLGELIPYW